MFHVLCMFQHTLELMHKQTHTHTPYTNIHLTYTHSQYTVYQKQFQIPSFVSKTIQYPAPVYQLQPAAPVQITQLPIPVYQPVVYQKRIHINTVPQVCLSSNVQCSVFCICKALKGSW